MECGQLAASITAAGKLAQAQRESWVVVNDGVQLDTDNQPPKKAMDNWNATEASDAMSTSLGPWFAQVCSPQYHCNERGLNSTVDARVLEELRASRKPLHSLYVPAFVAHLAGPWFAQVS
jgi:hypothetical protein